MKPKNYYEILGVPYDADKATIRSAYRKLAQQYHPDKTENKDDTKFKEIVEAYETLRNDDSRKKYDNNIYNIYFRNYSPPDTTYTFYGRSFTLLNLIIYIFLILCCVYVIVSIIYSIIISYSKSKVNKKHTSIHKKMH